MKTFSQVAKDHVFDNEMSPDDVSVIQWLQNNQFDRNGIHISIIYRELRHLFTRYQGLLHFDMFVPHLEDLIEEGYLEHGVNSNHYKHKDDYTFIVENSQLKMIYVMC